MALERPPICQAQAFMADGVDLKGWKILRLYLIWAPVDKQPAEKEIIRALKNLAKKEIRHYRHCRL